MNSHVIPFVEDKPTWMVSILRAAAAYNLAWGISIVIFPHALFDWTGIQRPLYPQIWQCVGMIVGVYGIGYGIASFDPIRHWPIVFVGLIGKIFGPIGFLLAVLEGGFPVSWGWTIVTNDIIWWGPFFLILRKAYQGSAEASSAGLLSVRAALEQAQTQNRETVAAISDRSPVLLVLLRHLGCAFCREALTDIASRRDALKANGVRPVLVHLSSNDFEARRVFAEFGLSDLDRVSDPDRVLYRAVGLRRGRFGQLFGPRVIARGIQAWLAGHGVALPKEDPLQMPGVFLLQNGKIVRAFRHAHAGERPDYAAMSVCEASNERMRRDLELAADVQRTLLPTSLPSVDGAEIAWAVEPTDELAGDTLNVVRLDENHLALYVLDVSGHGVSAALLSVTLNHWLEPSRGEALFRRTPGGSTRVATPTEVAEELNAHFPMDAETKQYFTLLYGILDTRTFKFSYVTAGHPPPIHVRSGGDSTQLGGTGFPVGLVADARYAEEEVELSEGDRLYMFSDGVLESGDVDGLEFGIDRTIDVLESARAQPLEMTVSTLLGLVKSWRTSAPYVDDLSVLSLEISTAVGAAHQEHEEVSNK